MQESAAANMSDEIVRVIAAAEEGTLDLAIQKFEALGGTLYRRYMGHSMGSLETFPMDL